MSNDNSARRVPWVALALSFLSAGVGHLYCGRIAKGIPLYFAWLLVPVCGFIAALGRPSQLGLVLLVLPTIVVVILYLYAAFDAWWLALQIGSDYALRDYNRASIYWLLIVGQLVFSIGLMAGICGSVYEAFLIPANSMSPTILNGDRVVARKLLPKHHFPERGDLIAYRNPTAKGAPSFIGRVVAVAGDEVAIQGDSLSVNGKELTRDRIPDETLRLFGETVGGKVAYESNSGRRYLVSYGDASNDGERSEEDFKATVPDRHVFVLGDNRDRSRDSRHFGAVHIGDVVGNIDYIFWPAESWSRLGVANDRLP